MWCWIIRWIGLPRIPYSRTKPDLMLGCWDISVWRRERLGRQKICVKIRVAIADASQASWYIAYSLRICLQALGVMTLLLSTRRVTRITRRAFVGLRQSTVVMLTTQLWPSLTTTFVSTFPALWCRRAMPGLDYLSHVGPGQVWILRSKNWILILPLFDIFLIVIYTQACVCFLQ